MIFHGDQSGIDIDSLCLALVALCILIESIKALMHHKTYGTKQGNDMEINQLSAMEIINSSEDFLRSVQEI